MTNYSTIVQWSDEDEGYIATVPELPGVSAFGETQEEAVRELEIAKRLMLKVYEEDGCQLPEPDKLREFSGQFRIRIPKSLHAALNTEAKKEGLSLNSYASYLLTKRHEQSRLEKKFSGLESAIHNQMFSKGDYAIPSSGSAVSVSHELNLEDWKKDIISHVQ